MPAQLQRGVEKNLRDDYGLNPRQKRFAEEYAACGCGERAAVAAGYSAASARQEASRLLTNVNIITYLRTLQDQLSETRVLTATETKIFWSDVVRDDNQKMTDRLQASVHLARASGLFREQVEMETHPDPEGETRIFLPAIKNEDGSWLDPPGKRGNDIEIYDPDNEVRKD